MTLMAGIGLGSFRCIGGADLAPGAGGRRILPGDAQENGVDGEVAGSAFLYPRSESGLVWLLLLQHLDDFWIDLMTEGLRGSDIGHRAGLVPEIGFYDGAVLIECT
ncbi:MAG: hypothetical protein RLZZ165_2083 [Bacteroidota bacterium]